MHSVQDDLSAGLPHSEIHGSKLGYQLPMAYRRFPRLSSPSDAKTSIMCPWWLDRTNRAPPCLMNRTRARLTRPAVVRKCSSSNRHTSTLCVCLRLQSSIVLLHSVCPSVRPLRPWKDHGLHAGGSGGTANYAAHIRLSKNLPEAPHPGCAEIDPRIRWPTLPIARVGRRV